MAKVSIEESTLYAIGDAIREKGGTTAGLNPEGEMPAAILALKGAEVEEITNEAGGKSVYINSEVPKLPDGYTRLKYIQSSGTQYVDTGFKPNQNTRVVMDLQGATTTSGVYMHYGVPSFMAGKASSSSWNYYVYYNTQEVAYSTRTASDFTARHTIDQNKNVITTGADTRTLTAATFSSGYNMYLFGVNNNGSLAYASPIKVFSCKIWDNGTLVRDFVPCMNAENVAGLYDVVNGVFYADAAGGSFVAGPVVLDYTLPEGYEELEYIQSSGRQYINTGFVPNQDTRVVCECDYSVTSSASWLFGVRVSSGQSAFAFLANNNKFRTDYKNSYTLNFAETTTRVKKVDKNKNVTTVNDGETITDTYADFDSVYPLYLFAINTAGSVSGFASSKLKMMQIYDNGTLVRYYVPCKSDTGAVGLWDVVNNTFTGDAAGVGFIAGPVVLEYKLPDGYEELQYIESSGSQYVDTGFKPNSNTRVVLDAYNLSAESKWILGAWTSSKSLQFASSCGSGYSYRYGSTSVSLTDVPVGALHVDFNKNAYNMNGATGTVSAQTFTCEYPMYLFTINAAGSPSSGKFTGRVMSGQIYDNGTLIRYYVPCKNASGAVGLWDAVNNTFTGDAAGVGFIAGPVAGTSVSKVVLEDRVLIDLTGDTVKPEALLSGFTAHNAIGQMILGAASAGKPVASGTFVQSALSQSVTVNGLDFKPNAVFLMWNGINRSQSRNLLAAACKPASSDLGFAAFLYYAYDGSDMFQFGIAGTYFVMNSNGFTCKTTSQQYLQGAYNWIAVG